jgi:RND family efflux transporter MFP subunit
MGLLLAAIAVLLTIGRAAAAEAVEQRFDCVIDPSETAKLGSPIVGVLSKVLVERGDLVTEGQPVAQLESSVEAAAVAYNRFHAESTARIEAQQQRLDLATARLERASQLIGKGDISKDKYQEMAADAGVAKADLVREQEDQKLAQLDLARSQATLEQRTIHSPFSGVVTEKKLSAGEFVSQESYVVAVARLDPLHVETYLPVSTYGQVSVGTHGIVYPNAPIGGQYSSAVIVVDHVFDPSSGTYGVRLELPNPDRKLPGGLRCKVGFQIAPLEQKTSGE